MSGARLDWVPYDDGVARRLIGEMRRDHEAFGDATDWLAAHESPIPGGVTRPSMRFGWVGDAVFFVDRDARYIFRSTLERAPAADALLDQDAEDRLVGTAPEEA